MIRYSQAVDEERRFEPYRRIGDVYLFLSGIFPSAIRARHRYPVSREIRPRARARTVVSREDYEAHGQVFYRLASEHKSVSL